MKLKSKTFLNFGIVGKSKTFLTFKAGEIKEVNLEDEEILKVLEPYMDSKEISVMTEPVKKVEPKLNNLKNFNKK